MSFTTIIVIALIIGAVGGILQASSNSKKEKERGEKFSERSSSIEGFNPSTTITGVKNFYKFLVDNEGRKICIMNEYSQKILPFEDIINVELIENGITLTTKSTIRTIGGTLVGGALAGGAGAIVGGLSGNSKNIQKVSDVQIRMRIRNLDDPAIVIKCFDAKTMTVEGKPIKPTSMEGHLYREGKQHAQRILDLVSVIIDDVDKNNSSATTITSTTTSSSSSTSIADELKKLAELKNDGILTQSEFDEQKAKILSQGKTIPEKNITDDSNTIESPNTYVDELSPELRQLINDGKILQAIKLYKDATGVSLSEAKAFIDAHK